ncbi:hypothetical protein ES702_05902 [subsurface metagenome]
MICEKCKKPISKFSWKVLQGFRLVPSHDSKCDVAAMEIYFKCTKCDQVNFISVPVCDVCINQLNYLEEHIKLLNQRLEVCEHMSGI